MTELKIAQFNCRGFRSKAMDIEEYFNSLEVDIICFNETKYTSTDHLQLPGYRVVSQTLSKTHGSAILVKEELQISESSIITEGFGLEILIVTLTCQRLGKFSVVLIYNSPQTILNEHLLRAAIQASHSVLLVGDFNAKSKELGNNLTNPSGTILVDVIENQSLTVLNDENDTFFNNRTSSRLDLHIANRNVATTALQFEVGEKLGSDHKVTLSTLKLSVEKDVGSRSTGSRSRD